MVFIYIFYFDALVEGVVWVFHYIFYVLQAMGFFSFGLLCIIAVLVPFHCSELPFVKNGFIVEKMQQPTVIYRAKSSHTLALKHLFLSYSEIQALQANLTVVNDELSRIKLNLLNITRNCPHNLRQICVIANRKFYYTSSKLSSLMDEIESLQDYANPSSLIQRRSVSLSTILKAADFTATLGALALGVVDYHRISVNREKITRLKDNIQTLTVVDRRQDSKLNELIKASNEVDVFLSKTEQLEAIVYQLENLANSMDDCHDLANNYKVQTADYILGLSLAYKNLFSPSLVPPNQLHSLLNKMINSLGWTPVLPLDKLEFYYHLIDVMVIEESLVLHIPFQPTRPFETYLLEPFPVKSKSGFPLVGTNALVVIRGEGVSYYLSKEEYFDKATMCHKVRVLPVNSGGRLNDEGHHCFSNFLDKEEHMEQVTDDKALCRGMTLKHFSQKEKTLRLFDGSLAIYSDTPFEVKCGNLSFQLEGTKCIAADCIVITSNASFLPVKTVSAEGSLRWSLLKRPVLNLSTTVTGGAWEASTIEEIRNQYPEEDVKKTSVWLYTTMTIAGAALLLIVAHLIYKRRGLCCAKVSGLFASRRQRLVEPVVRMSDIPRSSSIETCETLETVETREDGSPDSFVPMEEHSDATPTCSPVKLQSVLERE